MVFLTESQISKFPEVKRLAQARVSKLMNLKLHLKQLLAKKLRLELEIKHVTTVIKKKSKKNSKEIRFNLNLEQSQFLDDVPDLVIRLEAHSPEVIELLQEGDKLARELIDILEEEKLVTQEDIQELSSHL